MSDDLSVTAGLAGGFGFTEILDIPLPLVSNMQLNKAQTYTVFSESWPLMQVGTPRLLCAWPMSS